MARWSKNFWAGVDSSKPPRSPNAPKSVAWLHRHTERRRTKDRERAAHTTHHRETRTRTHAHPLNTHTHATHNEHHTPQHTPHIRSIATPDELSPAPYFFTYMMQLFSPLAKARHHFSSVTCKKTRWIQAHECAADAIGHDFGKSAHVWAPPWLAPPP